MTIAQGVTVHDVVVRDGTACGVVTDHGTIECEYVVNAASTDRFLPVLEAINSGSFRGGVLLLRHFL